MDSAEEEDRKRACTLKVALVAMAFRDVATPATKSFTFASVSVAVRLPAKRSAYRQPSVAHRSWPRGTPARAESGMSSTCRSADITTRGAMVVSYGQRATHPRGVSDASVSRYPKRGKRAMSSRHAPPVHVPVDPQRRRDASDMFSSRFLLASKGS
jgi:hypothetical protein